MVVTELEMIYHGELVELPSQSEQQPKPANPFPSLERQSSIYSLTLDEFQHALNESGKNFGSMNVAEFLTSIWNAEEDQAAAAAATSNNVGQVNKVGNQALNDVSPVDHQGLLKQPSLPRQGSLTLPPPPCRKTVDEVWSDMHRKQGHGQRNGGNNMQNPGSAPRQPTFGKMMLEDFLIKVGVVKEQFGVPTVRTRQQFGMYQGGNDNSSNTAVATGFASRPVIGMSAGPDGYAAVVSYQATHQGESSGRTGGYPPPPKAAGPPQGTAVYGDGYGLGQAMGMVGTMSPVSSDGLVAATVDHVGNRYGMDMGGLRVQKRIIDGPMEKVVERRHRRMIKNRESAAGSRARKQAYTVELEAELNQLKEENRQLKHALVELERKIKQQYFEDLKAKAPTKSQNPKDKLPAMRRNLSCSV